MVKRRSKRLEDHAMQPDEYLEEILDLLETMHALLEKVAKKVGVDL